MNVPLDSCRGLPGFGLELALTASPGQVPDGSEEDEGQQLEEPSRSSMRAPRFLREGSHRRWKLRCLLTFFASVIPRVP